MAPPFGRLAFLYVGTKDLDRDLGYYTNVLGAKVLWNYREFGAQVASVRLSEGPQFILADHHPSPSVLPIFEVRDLKATSKGLRAHGWKPEGRSFEIPPGPCFLFQDPSGNELAIFENLRPEAMAEAFGERGGESASLRP